MFDDHGEHTTNILHLITELDTGGAQRA